jgi:hypothetical protein
MRRLLARLLLAAAALLAALLLVEAGVRLTRIDGAMMSRTLYYQGGRLPLHQVVDDPDLLYTLRPGARDEMVPYQGDPCAIRIDSMGARGPQREALPRAGATRILFFGASTIFGVGVCDDQTLPAALERALDQRRPGPHEVLNFGTSAYTGSQVVHRARVELARVEGVDLLVLLPTNVGRRPFLDGEEQQKLDYYRFFRADPILWLENFYRERPWPGLSLRVTNRLHWGWLRASALYRYAAIRGIPSDRTNMGWNPYVAERAAREAEQLEAEAAARGVAVVYVLYPQTDSQRPGFRERTYPFGSAWIGLDRPGLEAGDLDLHPTAPRLAAHAEILAERLIEGGWLE